ncbi:RHS repeat domain-containing protein, partial [Escherichia coli]
EVTTARGTYRYVYDALGRRTEKQHISPDGKPYNRTKFLWDGMQGKIIRSSLFVLNNSHFMFKN